MYVSLNCPIKIYVTKGISFDFLSESQPEINIIIDIHSSSKNSNVGSQHVMK